ncbi:MAG: Tex family protein, partial [Planctomycetota bacterium]
MDTLTASDFDRIAKELNLNRSQVESATTLLDEGNTIPFVTRYRKERTGHLDEEQLRLIEQRVTALRQLKDRALTITRLIESQGKLTPELRREIENADSTKRLEDLYLPFRPKKRSRASMARDRGLEPLADRVWQGDPSLTNLESAAVGMIAPDKDLPSSVEVLQGVADLIAERIGDDAELRSACRQLSWQTGKLTVTGSEADSEKAQPYRDYFNYQEAISRMPPHRVLALNRGEKESILRVKFVWDDERATAITDDMLRINQRPHGTFIRQCAEDALSRLVHPSLDREVRRELTERAEIHAVQVFAKNLRNLLLQPPLRGKRVLAIDPGFRTGCKVAVLDEIGNCLVTDVVYLTGSADKRVATKQKLVELLQQYETRLIVLGNGTACRESEELVAEIISETLPDLQYTIVNEAGASIYSTSTVAREEFPNYDATIRGTISIGRRLQDPLSELVKIEPQHIGVGMYQHDLTPKLLKESLESVVESCVNYVGVDLNTASPALLSRVSGLNQLTARRVVEWRERHGRFQTRKQLKDVAGIGDATFTQAAGFLKITGGDQPLDQTWIHPESYPAAKQVLAKLRIAEDGLQLGAGLENTVRERLAELNIETLADEIGVGVLTLRDILDALARPGRDPRTDLQGHVFKQGILKLEDLAPGMEVRGTVLNVVDFGVFVDIGLKDSGLVHISQMSKNYVRSPHDVAAVGDVVTAWVLQIDTGRRRVSLTMINPAASQEKPASRPAPATKPAATAEKTGTSDRAKSGTN